MPTSRSSTPTKWRTCTTSGRPAKRSAPPRPHGGGGADFDARIDQDGRDHPAVARLPILCFMLSVHDTVARHEAREEGAPSLTKGSDYAPTATPGRDATSRIQARAALGPGSECTRLPEGGPPDQGVPRGTSRPRVGHVRPTRPRRSARLESQVRRGDIVTVATGKPRPAVVVQSDHLLPYPTMIVVPFTSEIDARPPPFTRITVDPTPANGLRRVSQIMVDRIIGLPAAKLRPTAGRLDDGQMTELTH